MGCIEKTYRLVIYYVFHENIYKQKSLINSCTTCYNFYCVISSNLIQSGILKNLVYWSESCLISSDGRFYKQKLLLQFISTVLRKMGNLESTPCCFLDDFPPMTTRHPFKDDAPVFIQGRKLEL